MSLILKRSPTLLFCFPPIFFASFRCLEFIIYFFVCVAFKSVMFLIRECTGKRLLGSTRYSNWRMERAIQEATTVFSYEVIM